MLLSICFHSKWRLSMVDYCRTEDIAISTALDAPQDGLPNFGEARWPTWRRRWIWDLSKVFGQSLGLSKLKWRYCRDIWWRLSPPKTASKRLLFPWFLVPNESFGAIFCASFRIYIEKAYAPTLGLLIFLSFAPTATWTCKLPKRMSDVGQVGRYVKVCKGIAWNSPPKKYQRIFI